MTSIKQAVEMAEKLLLSSSTSPRIDGELLICHVLKKTRTYLYTHPELILTLEQQNQFQKLVTQRQQGQPIAYLLGEKEFWSLRLTVNQHTLIPRPETELLVQLCLDLVEDLPNTHVLDLGTGSGAIALALASEKPHWHITAVDNSPNALLTATQNAHDLNLSRVQFLQSNWFENITVSMRFSVIVANPPYLADNDSHLQQGDLRFEPTSALVAGKKGLADLEEIIAQSISYLKPGGLLLLEHGFDQKFAVGSMLKDYGYEHIQCWQDWQKNDRISGGRLKIS